MWPPRRFRRGPADSVRNLEGEPRARIRCRAHLGWPEPSARDRRAPPDVRSLVDQTRTKRIVATRPSQRESGAKVAPEPTTCHCGGARLRTGGAARLARSHDPSMKAGSSSWSTGDRSDRRADRSRDARPDPLWQRQPCRAGPAAKDRERRARSRCLANRGRTRSRAPHRDHARDVRDPEANRPLLKDATRGRP